MCADPEKDVNIRQKPTPRQVSQPFHPGYLVRRCVLRSHVVVAPG